MSTQTDSAAILREALDAHIQNQHVAADWQFVRDQRLLEACRQHLPAVLSELDALRVLAKAAVEWHAAHSKVMGMLHGSSHLTEFPPEWDEANMREEVLHKSLTACVKAYAARQTGGGTHV